MSNRGWFSARQGATATLLFWHGNAGKNAHRLDNMRLLLELNLQVFIVDYRGYGESGGTLHETGTYDDALVAWRWLVENHAGPHLIFGRSLGNAVAIWLATRAEVVPAGVIVEST